MRLNSQLLSLLTGAILICLTGCTNLSSINVNFTDWSFTDWDSSRYATRNWLSNAKNTSACIFTCLSGLLIKRGDSYIPSLWTINTKILLLPLCFTALLNNSTILLVKVGSPSAILLYYDKNDTGLLFFEPNVTKVTLNKGLFVKFRNKKTIFSKNSSNYYYFKMSGKIAATGNTNSLINYSNLTNYCYYNLFLNCFSLISAPELPASSLADNCYVSMFLRLLKFNCCT